MRYVEEWTIAYRRRPESECLIHNQENEFKIIKNTWRYWCADPHLFEYDNHTYVFGELYDRVLRRGVIGFCEITDNGCTPWKVVLKMPWHLSYPHIFALDNKVYMIPESYMGNEIAVYKAASFPDKWIKVHVLKPNCVAVDSTLFFDQKKYWMQTLEFDNDHSYFNLYTFNNGELSNCPYVIRKNDDNVRPAGNLFVYKGKLIRPAQDCSASYGCALNFYQITKIAENDYEETLLQKITPSLIRSNFHTIPQGIHTYNSNEKYEIIDLKEYKIDLWSYIMRPVWFAWHRIKKILGR